MSNHEFCVYLRLLSVVKIESQIVIHVGELHKLRPSELQFCEKRSEMVIKRTLGFLAKISFTPLLYHPGGCFECPEKGTSSRNYNLFVWSAVFQPKWNDIKKTYKNCQNPVKSYCF